MIANNNDTGSCLIPESNGKISVGDKIRVNGREYTVSYIMGKGDKRHVCAKGCGPFPTGPVEVELASEALAQVG